VPKVTDAYRDSRREQILTAARRCFLRQGFHAASMQDLFTEVGLSSGAVYRYFPSKDALIIAIAEDNMRDVVDMIHTIATRRSEDSVTERHARDGLAGLAVQVWAEALSNPVVAERLGVLLSQLRADIAVIVGDLQAAGSLPAGVSDAALASVLLAIIPGSILQLALTGPSALADVPEALRALLPQTAGPRD
jgi:TetR/AcrR family transcriptional regulator, transcriptional repressor of aconitase